MLAHKNSTIRTQGEKGTKARIKSSLRPYNIAVLFLITDLRLTEVFSCYRSLSQCLGQQLSVTLSWFQRQNLLQEVLECKGQKQRKWVQRPEQLSLSCSLLFQLSWQLTVELNYHTSQTCFGVLRGVYRASSGGREEGGDFLFVLLGFCLVSI